MSGTAAPSQRPAEEKANPAGFIYGVLAISTVVAAESTRRETFGKLLAASAVTIGLYWLAHAYSHHWASRLQAESAWTGRQLAGALAREAPILAGALIPVAVLAVAWSTGASIETGVTAELWSAGVEIALLEVVVGLRRHMRRRDMAIQTAIGVALGLGILALRILLH